MVLQIADYFRKISRKEQGFTLIELVIVVAIIAILIAVAIPIYQNVTRTAAERSHDTNLRTIDSAVQQYFMAEGKYPAAGAVSIAADGNLEGFLDEVPDIPELAKANLTGGDDAAEVYTLVKGTDDDMVWAGPTGTWDGAYRKGK